MRLFLLDLGRGIAAGIALAIILFILVKVGGPGILAVTGMTLGAALLCEIVAGIVTGVIAGALSGVYHRHQLGAAFVGAVCGAVGMPIALLPASGSLGRATTLLSFALLGLFGGAFFVYNIRHHGMAE